MGKGETFSDVLNPRPVVRVGRAGDSGKVEITDMMFTVYGATAGAVVVEWNLNSDGYGPGAAAMWGTLGNLESCLQESWRIAFTNVSQIPISE